MVIGQLLAPIHIMLHGCHVLSFSGNPASCDRYAYCMPIQTSLPIQTGCQEVLNSYEEQSRSVQRVLSLQAVSTQI
jgi:hypothetical protein